MNTKCQCYKCCKCYKCYGAEAVGGGDFAPSIGGFLGIVGGDNIPAGINAMFYRGRGFFGGGSIFGMGAYITER